jgi:hypothetical protein
VLAPLRFLAETILSAVQPQFYYAGELARLLNLTLAIALASTQSLCNGPRALRSLAAIPLVVLADPPDALDKGGGESAQLRCNLCLLRETDQLAISVRLTSPGDHCPLSNRDFPPHAAHVSWRERFFFTHSGPNSHRRFEGAGRSSGPALHLVCDEVAQPYKTL